MLQNKILIHRVLWDTKDVIALENGSTITDYEGEHFQKIDGKLYKPGDTTEHNHKEVDLPAIVGMSASEVAEWQQEVNG